MTQPAAKKMIMAVSAGMGQPSASRLLSDRLGWAVAEALPGGADVVNVELRTYAHEITDRLLTGFAGPGLKSVLSTLAEADGLIAVSPIFSASYSGLFKSFFDGLDPDHLSGLPVALGATGGTARHSLALEFALRPLFSYLGARTTATAVFAATDDWGQVSGGHNRSAADHSPLAERINQVGAELATMISGGQAQRTPDPYEHPVPFEDLLGRRGPD